MMKKIKIKEKSPLREILKYLKPKIGMLILAFVFTAVCVAGTLFSPVIIGNAIDAIVGTQNVDFDVIFVCAMQLIAIIALVLVCKWLGEVATFNVSFNVVAALRQDLFKKINSVPIKTLDTIPQGELTSRVIFDTEKISDGLVQGTTQAISGVLTILGTLVLMLMINVWIALAVVVLTPMSILFASWLAKRTKHLFKKQSKLIGEISSLSTEYLSADKTVKAFGAEDDAERKFSLLNNDLRVVGDKAMFISSTTNPVTRFINGMIYAFVCFLGAYLTMQHSAMSIGQLTVVLTYANQYSKPFNEITGVITELQAAFAASKRVFDLLNIESEQEPISPACLPQNFDDIEFKNVSFYYDESRPLIKSLSLKLKSGSKVAIVGPTGAGKTTLINLLLRFYDPVSGSIEFGGVPINSLTREDLRSQFGLVLQDTWVFNGSYADNISFGSDSATMDEVIAVAEKCHLDSFIKRKKYGYNHLISSGSSISQGQVQLLTIARAMLKNPKILVLDEATSSVDTRTEKLIVAAMNELTKNRTSFVIAHRLSTIKDADLILVMKDGDVIEQGNHETLMSSNSFYKFLYNSQF